MRKVQFSIASSIALIAGATYMMAAGAFAASTVNTPDFIAKASASNLFEIETSQVALNVSKNTAVRSFAEQMVTDHGKAGTKMEEALAKDHLSAPKALDAYHQAKLDHLKGQTGPAFDQEYISLQKEAHADAVMLFTDYSATGDDARLKAFATKTLPTLKMHKMHVDKLN